MAHTPLHADVFAGSEPAQAAADYGPVYPIPAVCADLSRYIDHTLLRATATAADIELLCQQARTHGFATVCVNAVHVAQCERLLRGCAVRPIAVVGFPLGACPTAVKVYAAQQAVGLGAQEIDMVIDLGALKSHDSAAVQRDIAAVVDAVPTTPIKVIIETCLLSHADKLQACAAVKRAGAAFVKTSTGFSTGGATEADVALLRQCVGQGLGVKASGGVRCAADVRRMLAAGANRVGASASVQIVTEAAGAPA
jgi:deoxyribose-phosphate aldolase